MSNQELSQNQASQLQQNSPSLIFIDCKPHWELSKSFKVVLSSGEKITIKKGFETDLASIPRLFWFILPPFGKYNRAAVVHDYLYKQKTPRSVADREFLFLLKEDNVGLFVRTCFYLAVRCFGWISY